MASGARTPASNGRHYDGGRQSEGSYKRFTDMPDVEENGYAKVYKGSEAETEEFFRRYSNKDELWDRVSQVDMEDDYSDASIEAVIGGAFEKWTTGKFMQGQQYNGWDNMSKKKNCTLSVTMTFWITQL